MGTFLVIAGRVRFPRAAALATWKALVVDGASVGKWCEPLEGPAGEPLDALTVAEVLARASRADFAAGRVATRTDGLEVALAAALEEGDGVATWAPLLVAAMRRASSVGAKGELVVGYADEVERTSVRITAKGSSMAPIDDDDARMAALDAVLPAVELHTGARTELDPPRDAAPTPKKQARTGAPKKSPPVKRPLRWKRVTSSTTSALHAVTAGPAGTIWAAGDAGALLTGPVAGPWIPVATGVTTAFHDVLVEGDRRVWVAGLEILRSDDGGRTFVRATRANASAATTSIWADGDRAVSVDAAGDIRLSTDAGESWTTVRSTGAALSRIREGAGALWVVGAAGSLLVLHDRGASFEVVPVVPASYVDVVFVGSTRMLVSLDEIRAGDPPTAVGPKHHRDVEFGKASVAGSVLWVKHEGAIRSEDGGVTWEQTYPRDSDFPLAVLALGPRSALIVGPRGSAWLAS